MNEGHTAKKLAVSPALEQVPEWRRRREKRGHLLLALDFDGTISPLVKIPDEAQLLPGARPVIERLLKRRDTAIAFVSGRSLADLRRRCAFDDAYYAGNHGIEIDGPGVHYVQPEAEARLPVMRGFADRLRAELGAMPRVIVEDKDLTLSVHFRGIEDEQEQLRVQQRVQETFARSDCEGLKLTYGKRVVEVRPDIDWNKGHALRYLINTLREPFVIFAGDDKTDEDGFAKVHPEGVGVIVAQETPKETHANYYVRSIEEMVQLLESMA